jgi:hypothetical protein
VGGIHGESKILKSRFAIVQVDPAKGRDLHMCDSLLVTEFFEQEIYMWQVIRGHVLDEDSRKFIVANAAV